MVNIKLIPLSSNIVVECNCVDKVVHVCKTTSYKKDAILDTAILDVAILDLSTESIAAIEP